MLLHADELGFLVSVLLHSLLVVLQVSILELVDGVVYPILLGLDIKVGACHCFIPHPRIMFLDGLVSGSFHVNPLSVVFLLILEIAVVIDLISEPFVLCAFHILNQSLLPLGI